MTYTLSQANLDRCKSLTRSDRARVIDIIQAVADASGVSADDIINGKRDATTCRARWLVCYLAHVEEGITSVAVGKALRMHHTSVLYGVGREREARMAASCQ